MFCTDDVLITGIFCHGDTNILTITNTIGYIPGMQIVKVLLFNPGNK